MECITIYSNKICECDLPLSLSVSQNILLYYTHPSSCDDMRLIKCLYGK